MTFHTRFLHSRRLYVKSLLRLRAEIALESTDSIFAMTQRSTYEENARKVMGMLSELSSSGVTLLWRFIKIEKEIFSTKSKLDEIIETRIMLEEQIFEKLQEHWTTEPRAALDRAIMKITESKHGNVRIGDFYELLFNQQLSPRQREASLDVLNRQVLYNFKSWQAVSLLRNHRVRQIGNTDLRLATQLVF